MNDTDRGYILAVKPYREYDAMISFLGEKYGKINLVLPGFYKAKSKQLALGLEYTFVEYNFNYKEDKLNRIIQGRLLDGFRHVREDYDWLLRMSLLSEVTSKLYDKKHHEFFYEIFQGVMSDNASEASLIKFLVHVIEVSGFSPSVDTCVYCEKTSINEFSIQDGGFLCLDHARKKDDPLLLRFIYQVFHHQYQVISEYSADLRFKLIDQLTEYLSFHSDLRFHSIALFNHV